jgi:type IV secretion system protein TrbL
MKSSFSAGAKSAFEASGGSSSEGTIGGGTEAANDTATGQRASFRQGPPDWAKRMKRSQSITHGVQAAAHAVRSGDSHGGGSSINLSESDR